MPMWVQWLVFLIGVGSFVFSVIWNSRSDKRATTHNFEERVKNDTRVNMKLDDIASVSREIKDDVSSMRRDILQHNERLIKVEESCKSAHKRIDETKAEVATLSR